MYAWLNTSLLGIPNLFIMIIVHYLDIQISIFQISMMTKVFIQTLYNLGLDNKIYDVFKKSKSRH